MSKTYEDLKMNRQKKMPNSHFSVIENCGHIPQEEKPEETAARILRFLTGYESMKLKNPDDPINPV